MATPSDARDRVLAARADLEDQVDILVASGRAAVDIPAKIRRSPARAVAVAGGVGFLALKGPQRILGLGRRAVFGKSGPVPKAMLPDEIEKSLKKLGPDGDRIRGTLERDFAEYAAKGQKTSRRQRRLLFFAVAEPVLVRAARAGADWLMAPDKGSFERRLADLRSRVEGAAGTGNDDLATTADAPAPPPASPEPPTPPR